LPYPENKNKKNKKVFQSLPKRRAVCRESGRAWMMSRLRQIWNVPYFSIFEKINLRLVLRSSLYMEFVYMAHTFVTFAKWRRYVGDMADNIYVVADRAAIS
jgi:hypothetical protein